LNQETLERLASGSGLVRRVIWLDETDSTQDELRRRAAAGRDEGGLLVAAGRQTAGRGRRGRAWFSPAGQGLWFSLLFTPPGPRTAWPFVTALAALGLRRALEEASGVSPRLKWPNDLLYEGRKLAGILAETVARSVALGIGVNLAQVREDFPGELRELAVSVRMAAGRSPEPEQVLGLFLRTFEALLERFGREGAAPFRADLRSASVLLGRMVWLSDGRSGRVIDLGEAGELILEMDGGAEGASAEGAAGAARPSLEPADGRARPAGARRSFSIASGEIERIEPPLR